jgi:hypothetical protein
MPAVLRLLLLALFFIETSYWGLAVKDLGPPYLRALRDAKHLSEIPLLMSVGFIWLGFAYNSFVFGVLLKELLAVEAKHLVQKPSGRGPRGAQR